MWSSVLLILSISVAARAQPGDSGTGGTDGIKYNLTFLVPENVPVCGSVDIQYSVDPPLNTLLPVVLSIGYSGNGVIAQLTSAAQLGAGKWTWDPINVPPGLYQLFGRSLSSDYNIVGSSNDFAVIVEQSGPSLSCLSQSPSTSVPPPTTSPPTSSNIVVGSSVPGTSPSAATSSPPSPSGTGNATAVDVNSNPSSAPSLSTGVKAGVSVAGALIAISALTALYWYCMARRRKPNNKTASPSGAEGGGGARRWTGLASVDEYHGQGYTTSSASREAKSYGSTNYPATPTAVAAASNTRTQHSPVFDEKPSPASPYTPTYADGLSYPPQDINPGLAYFPSASYNNNSPPRTPIYSSPAVEMIRSGSHSSTNSRSRSTTGSSQSDFPYPIAGVNGVPIPEGRSGLGDNKKGPIARKPVPSYKSEQRTPEDEYPIYNVNRYSSNTLDNPFAGGSESHESHLSPPQPTHPQHELQHKASFGEKPMQHVLIPDMPPPRVASPPPVGIGR